MPETRDPRIDDMVRRVVMQSPEPPAFPAEAERAVRYRHALVLRGVGLVGTIAIVVAVALVAAAAISGSRPEHRIIVTNPPPPRSHELEAKTVLDGPPGNTALIGTSFIADPRSGMWLLTWSSRGTHLDHIDDAGLVRSITLPTDFAETGGAIAADPDGTVWAASAKTLAKITGNAASAPELIPLGPWPNSHNSVWTASSDGAGHVALATDQSGLVRIYDSSTRTFSDAKLPHGTQARSLQYVPDGSLAIGLSGTPSAAVILSPAGVLSASVPVSDTQMVSTYSDTSVLFGPSDPTVLNRNGTTRRIALPDALNPNRRYLPSSVQAGRDGTLVVRNGDAITILASASDPVPTATFNFPRYKCGPSSGMGPTQPADAQSLPRDSACRTTPNIVRVDTHGNIWLFYNYLPDLDGPHLIVKKIDRY